MDDDEALRINPPSDDDDDGLFPLCTKKTTRSLSFVSFSSPLLRGRRRRFVGTDDCLDDGHACFSADDDEWPFFMWSKRVTFHINGGTSSPSRGVEPSKSVLVLPRAFFF